MSVRDVTGEDIQITVYYTSLDEDGAATAKDVRSLLTEVGLLVRPGESLSQWRFEREGITYHPAVGFGSGGAGHGDLITIVLDWLTPWLNPVSLAASAAGAFACKGFLEAAGKDAWAGLKAGILAVKQHTWDKRPPRQIRLMVPIATPDGVRWLGLELPSLTEDFLDALVGLDDVHEVPLFTPGRAVTWLRWEAVTRRWIAAGSAGHASP